jgi:hypothetical protein
VSQQYSLLVFILFGILPVDHLFFVFSMLHIMIGTSFVVDQKQEEVGKQERLARAEVSIVFPC